jgi:hypothetical protein
MIGLGGTPYEFETLREPEERERLEVKLVPHRGKLNSRRDLGDDGRVSLVHPHKQGFTPIGVKPHWPDWDLRRRMMMPS